MSNKVIAVRQADGSFYPIMKEGEAGTKSLQLTTVRDNQTTVKVNLYKLTENSDEEPKYMDTLLIENLNTHLQGEASLNLDLSIDDNNMVSAQVIDPETGAASNTEVSLVTLAEHSLDNISDFTIDSDQNEEPSLDTTNTDDLSLEVPEDFSTENEAEEPLENDDLNDPDLGNLPDFDDIDTTIPETDNDITEDISTNNSNTFSEPETNTDNFDAPDLEDLPDFDSTDLPDFEDTALEDVTPEDITPEDVTSEDTERTPVSDTKEETSEPEIANTKEISETENYDDTEDTNFDTSDLDDLPDFDTPIIDDNKPQIKTDNLYQETQPSTGTESRLPPLYDETLSDDVEKIETKERRKFRIPLIICFICTLLCIAAVILIFILGPFPPSKNSNALPPVAENIVTTEAPIEQVTQIPEEKIGQISEKEVIAENTIEVVPEETVPEPIVAVEKTEINAVSYLLRWGDTLWDLSETYYRNPWLYDTIAEHNHIKNPDMIIAGTYIEIPAR
ncbi:MAG: hypothetical protein BKP49_02095 [Treponema sp. CETP13]|nr:MAG: hypothetical protein BKP49_02095 [Treponema sp. CETP13]